jgi:hypothetical protein
MLYRFTLSEEGAFEYHIDPGAGIAFAFTLAPSDVKNVIIVQIAPNTQDNALRCWVSHQMGGTQVVEYPINVAFWHANRVPNEIITVYDQALPPPVGAALPLAPGSYYVNILNLTNEKNAFSFVLTDVAA